MNSAFLRTQWDRVTAWVATALGAVLLIVGYIKVSGTAFPAEQVPYLVSAGLGALFLLGLAGTLWISADLRDEYAKLDEIAQTLAVRTETSAQDMATSDAPTEAAQPHAAAATPAQVAPLRRRPRAAARSASGA